jgi:Mn-containing catalase
MTREITHMRAFAAASESMGKPAFTIGRIAPHLVDQFFNNSTGQGDHGEIDARGPWNEGGQWEFVQAPAFQGLGAPRRIARRSTSKARNPRT